MLGLMMLINIDVQGWRDLSIRSTKAGEVKPAMTWFVLESLFMPSICF
jgi:hypothetical protein